MASYVRKLADAGTNSIVIRDYRVLTIIPILFDQGISQPHLRRDQYGFSTQSADRIAVGAAIAAGDAEGQPCQYQKGVEAIRGSHHLRSVESIHRSHNSRQVFRIWRRLGSQDWLGIAPSPYLDIRGHQSVRALAQTYTRSTPVCAAIAWFFHYSIHREQLD